MHAISAYKGQRPRNPAHFFNSRTYARHWFTLLLQFLMVLLHILMNATILRSVFSRTVHGIAIHSLEYNTELGRPN